MCDLEDLNKFSLSPREKLLFLSRLQEKIERWEDVVDTLIAVINLQPKMTHAERDLFGLACRRLASIHREARQALLNAEISREKKTKAEAALHRATTDTQPDILTPPPAHERRASHFFPLEPVVNGLNDVPQTQERPKVSYSSMQLEVTSAYRQQIDGELKKLCDLVNDVLREKLIPNTDDGEDLVFYWKMRGDYTRYSCEVASNSGTSVEATQELYLKAKAIADEFSISPVSPLRLALALNYSVFCDEVLKDGELALQLATEALEDAIPRMDEACEEDANEIMHILQLLQSNVSIWKSGTDSHRFTKQRTCFRL